MSETTRLHVRFDAPEEAVSTETLIKELADRIGAKFEVLEGVLITSSTKPGHVGVEFLIPTGPGTRWEDLDFDAVKDHVRDMLAGDFGDYGNTANVHAAGGMVESPIAAHRVGRSPEFLIPDGFKSIVIKGGPDGNSTQILNADGTPIEGVVSATIELNAGGLNRAVLVIDGVHVEGLKAVTEDPLASKEIKGDEPKPERRKSREFGGPSS